MSALSEQCVNSSRMFFQPWFSAVVIIRVIVNTSFEQITEWDEIIILTNNCFLLLQQQYEFSAALFTGKKL